jgi:PTH1 family peptidyl-tRNA hydrolase
MILIVGLGNPGIKYKRTRHNIGFRALDEFQKENDFPDFKFSKKFNALISKKDIGKKKIILAKPQTFMNKSGQAVKKITTYHSLPTINLVIVHDDIDLPLGKIRIVKKRGSAGHKGIESIIKELGTKNFVRLRVGIQPKEKIRMGAFVLPKPEGRRHAIRMQEFVLENFTEEEEKTVGKIIKKSCSALKIILSEGPEKTMNKFNI